VKEIAAYDGDISGYVPAQLVERVKSALK
jgi:phosphopantetheine adenylyltransferase